MLRNLLLAGLAVLGFVSCGGGGEDEPPAPRGSVTIEQPTTADAFNAAPSQNTIVLSGIASNANQITNCLVFGQQNIADIGTTVRWINAAGGSGTASQSVSCSTLTGTGGGNGWLCALSGNVCVVGEHNWTATIPIVTGANLVTVTVTDANGEMGRDTITITR